LPEERRLGENGGIRLTSESDGGGNSRWWWSVCFVLCRDCLSVSPTQWWRSKAELSTLECIFTYQVILCSNCERFLWTLLTNQSECWHLRIARGLGNLAKLTFSGKTKSGLKQHSAVRSERFCTQPANRGGRERSSVRFWYFKDLNCMQSFGCSAPFDSLGVELNIQQIECNWDL
jgi:hypothetical protein